MRTESTRLSSHVIALVALPALALLPSALTAQGGADDLATALRAADAPGPDIGAVVPTTGAAGEHASETARQLVRLATAPALDGRERAETLQLAARLYGHAGDLESARRTFTRAGLFAYRTGQSRLAVRLFLDAATAALEEGDRRAAWIAAQRAGKVIHRSDFTPDEKLRMLARVVFAGQPSKFQVIEPLAEQ